MTIHCTARARCPRSFTAVAFVGAVILASAAAAALSDDRMAVGQPMVGAPARVTLTADRGTFLLGENVLVHFCVQNVSQQHFEVEFGGDYRFANRSLRFQVTVLDEVGAAMPDPAPSSRSGGGLSQKTTLAPGESHCESLPLLRYARIDRPGRYLVRARHDLGWAAGTAPTGELRLRFTVPDVDEVARVVSEALAASSRENLLPDGRSTPWGDPTTLRYRVYLPELLARAEAGEPRAAISIGEIPSPEATKALLQLARHQNHEVARAAIAALSERLPDPELAGELTPRNAFSDPARARRDYLRQTGWRSEFLPETRLLGRDLLSAAEPQDVAAGAYLMQCVGTADDMPFVSVALTTAIQRAQHDPIETGIYPRPHGAAGELVRAAQVLLARGARPSEIPESPGEWGVYFVQARRDPTFGAAVPAGTWALALGSPFGYLRQLALESVIGEPPAAVGELLSRLFTDADLDVRIEACRVAGRSRDTALVPSLLDILRTTSDAMLFNAAFNAAHALGGYYEALLVAADRLPEEEQFGTMMGYLAGLVEGSSGHGADYQKAAAHLTATRRHWIDFLREHRAEIAAGKRFSLGDPRLSAGLFPPGFSFWTADGKRWP